MKKIKLLLFTVALISVTEMYSQTGIAYNYTKTFSSNATSSNPNISTTIDNSSRIINIGQYTGTIDIDPGTGTQNLTSTNWCAFIQKLDISGNLIWGKSLGNNGTSSCFATAVVAGNNNDLYLCGYYQGTVDLDPGTGVFNVTSAGINNSYILKLDSSGNFVWAKTFSCTGNMFFSRIDYDPINNRVIAGGAWNSGGTVDADPGAGVVTLNVGGGNDGLAVQLDAAGNYVNYIHINSGGTDQISGLAYDNNGNYYAVGEFAGTVDFDPTSSVSNVTAVGQTDAYLVKYSPAGALQSVKVFAGAGFERALSVTFTTNNTAYVTGSSTNLLDLNPGAGIANFDNGGTYSAVWFVRLNSNLDYVSHGAFSGGDSYFTGLVIRHNGNVIINGMYHNTVDFDPGAATVNHTSVNATTYDEYFVQLDDSLQFMNMELRPSASTSFQYHGNKSIAIFGGYVIRAGAFSGTHDLNMLAGTDNFTASTSGGDYYITRMDFCTGPSFATITANTCGSSYTAPSGAVFSASGIYNDTITSIGGCDSIITITLTVTQPAATDVTVNATSDSICMGDQVTFVATPINGGPSPAFAWYINNVLQSTNASFSSVALSNGDEIYCQMTSSLSCVTSATAISDTVTMVVGVPNGNAYVGISASPGNSVCSADTVTFTANYLNGGNYPNFSWTVNNVPQNINNPTLILTGLQNGDQVQCVLTSSDGCLSVMQYTSNLINMTVTQSVMPMVSINGPTAICAGDTGVYNATITDGGSAPIVNWYINSNTTPVGSGLVYSTSTIGNYDTLFCVLINNDACAVPNYDISNSIVVAASSTVVPSITVSAVNISACAGEPLTFTSSSIGEGSNPSYQWYVNGLPVNGATNSTFTSTTLTNNAGVSCILTSSLACASPVTDSSNLINVSILTTPVLNQNVNICFGAQFAVGSNIYTSTGVYHDTLNAVNGCDSIINTTLTVYPQLNTTITVNGGSVTVGQNNASYQWLDCDNNYAAIPGANSQTYFATVDGNYAVAVTANGCTDTSGCVSVLAQSITDTYKAPELNSLPNPTENGQFKVTFGNTLKNGTLTMTNETGQIICIHDISGMEKIELNTPCAGVFFVTVETEDTSRTIRVLSFD